MLSEMDSLSPPPRQALHVFDSIQQMAVTVEDSIYSDILFSKFVFDGTQWLAIAQLDSVEKDFMSTREKPSVMVERAWKKDLMVTDLAYGQGGWILYGREDPEVDQVLAHTTDFNKIPVLIWERWAEGYVVTEVCAGDGAWGLVFSRAKYAGHPLSGLVQVYSTLSGDFEEVQEKVKSRWGQNFAITSMASSGNLWVIIGTQHPGIVSQQIVLAKDREQLLEVLYRARQAGLTVTELVALQ